MPRKLKQVNYEERNGKKRVLFIFGLTLILILGSVAVMVLIPYLNTLPLYRSYFRSYTTAYIKEDSELTTDKTFVINTTNTDGNEEELIFSSEDGNAELGTFVEPKYIYCDRGGVDSNISVSFTVKEKEALNIICHIFVCDEDGDNIVMLENDEVTITEGNPYITSFIKEESGLTRGNNS